ncbi:hypothetical protein ACFLRF_01670 [Candidatus Altiarchaeota archaeon]
MPKRVKLYASLEQQQKDIVDTVFAGTSLKEIKQLGLPEPGALKERLGILYPGQDGMQADILEDYRAGVAIRALGKRMGAVQIGSLLGKPRRTMSDILNGSRPGEFSRISDIREYAIPTEKNVEFARFLGYVLSTQSKFSQKNVIVFGETDEKVRDDFERSFKEIWKDGKISDLTEHGNVVGKIVSSKELHNYVKLITKGFTTLPFEHLADREEKQAFVSAWLTNSSTIYTPGEPVENDGARKTPTTGYIQISKSVGKAKNSGTGALEDFRILLMDLGIGSSMSRESTRHIVRIKDLDDIGRLLNDKTPGGGKGYLLQDERREKLAGSRRKSLAIERGNSTRHDYYNFRELVSEGMDLNEAAEKFEITRATAAMWAKGGQKPIAVKKDDEVRALRIKRKPDEIGYAFRNISQIPGKARELAAENDMADLEAVKLRQDIGSYLWDKARPLLPAEQKSVLSADSMEAAKEALDELEETLKPRMRGIRERLVQGDESQVNAILGELPSSRVYIEGLKHMKSDTPEFPYDLIGPDMIVTEIVRRPELVGRILYVKMPADWVEPKDRVRSEPEVRPRPSQELRTLMEDIDSFAPPAGSVKPADSSMPATEADVANQVTDLRARLEADPGNRNAKFWRARLSFLEKKNGGG